MPPKTKESCCGASVATTVLLLSGSTAFNLTRFVFPLRLQKSYEIYGHVLKLVWPGPKLHNCNLAAEGNRHRPKVGPLGNQTLDLPHKRHIAVASAIHLACYWLLLLLVWSLYSEILNSKLLLLIKKKTQQVLALKNEYWIKKKFYIVSTHVSN